MAMPQKDDLIAAVLPDHTGQLLIERRSVACVYPSFKNNGKSAVFFDNVHLLSP